jgi:hypothetical protein
MLRRESWIRCSAPGGNLLCLPSAQNPIGRFGIIQTFEVALSEVISELRRRGAFPPVMKRTTQNGAIHIHSAEAPMLATRRGNPGAQIAPPRDIAPLLPSHEKNILYYFT